MFCTLNQLNKVWHVWPGSNDFHWMCQTNWPVELDLKELFFHLRAKGNEIVSLSMILDGIFPGLPDDIEAGPD